MPLTRNPARLAGLGNDAAVQRLLRACGADEACVAGEASDYDQFLALAEALPLCEGHPIRERVNAALTAATGLAVPLCPHTAKAHWDAWVETDLYGERITNPHLPSPCPCCGPVSPRVLRAEEICPLPDPCTVKSESTEAWSASLAAAFAAGEADGGFASLQLPDDFSFVRPDPYHAGLAVRRVAAGEAPAPRERDLLLAQALRVLGGAPARRTLLLRGGRPDAVAALLDYLHRAGALPALVWIPTDPADAGAVSGLYARVGTGLGEDTGEARAAYASVAPIGRAVILPG